MIQAGAIETRVAGVSFKNRDGSSRQKPLKRVKAKDPIELLREPQNPFDPNAIGVWWEDKKGLRHQLGYVPRHLAALLAPLLDHGLKVMPSVARRTGGGPLTLVGARLRLDGDFEGLNLPVRTGLEPVVLAVEALAAAVAADDAEGGPEDGMPALGGLWAD